MVTTSKKSPYALGLYRQLFALFIAAAAAAVVIAAPIPVHADAVAADGSVGDNTLWENGTASEWHLELQEQGTLAITSGIEAENDAEIREGFLEFDWGFAKQASNGSFPGTSGGSTGELFHSTSLFIEAVARAVLLLKSYSPTTYTLDKSYYDTKIADYTADVKAAAGWLTTPSIAATGQSYNLPYTHRRYVLAACLAESGALTGDSTFTADALPYAESGISLQKGAGWKAAIPNPVNGVYAPAVLMAPGAATPSNTYKVVSAVGVDPEKNGYDTQYQCMGLFYANTYYPYCTNSTVKTEIVNVIKNGLAWEASWVASDGTVSITGDSRTGIETDPDGDIKTPTVGLDWAAFDLGEQTTGVSVDAVYADRIANFGVAVDTNTIYPNGAVDGNEAWEKNKSLPMSISNQKIAVDWVERGIAQENDSFIQTGLSIINWGFLHMRSAGYFGVSTSLYYGSACFIEAAARASEDLKNYNPQTYTPSTDYTKWANATLSQCVTVCNWMTSSSVQAKYVHGIAAMTSHMWAVAAALSETGAYASMPDFQTDAQEFANDAINLQLPSGEDPENGAIDINNQTYGLVCAEHYAATCNSSSVLSATNDAIDNGLVWLGGYISPAGVISGTSSPGLLPMQHAYNLAANLPDSDYFQVVRYRLGGMPVE